MHLTLGTTGTTVQTVATTEQSARSGRNSANTTALTNLKTTLAAERAKQEAAADRLYRNSEQGGWNAYLIGVQTANTTYLGSVKTSENTYKTASDVADATYRAASVTVYVGYQNATRDLSALYSTAVARAGDTNFNLAAFFTATGGNTACQAYEFITSQEGNLHLAMPYDPAQIQTPVFSDNSDDSTIQSISDDFQQCWDSLPRKVPTEQKLIDWKMDIFTPRACSHKFPSQSERPALPTSGKKFPLKLPFQNFLLDSQTSISIDIKHPDCSYFILGYRFLLCDYMWTLPRHEAAASMSGYE